MVELLVSIAIVGVLLGIALPMLSGAMKTARGFRCQQSLRSVAFDFGVFADDTLHGDRGTDSKNFGPSRFSLETFQESQYGLDEFWAWGSANSHTVPDMTGHDPMRCAEVKGELTLLKNASCSNGALTPSKNVSYTFNARLWRPEVKDAPKLVSLTNAVVSEPRVPLAWDVNGAAAAAMGISPVFSTPSLGSTGAYANDVYWFPSMRHLGSLNVAFLDGSVGASKKPLEQPGWQWGYQPIGQ